MAAWPYYTLRNGKLYDEFGHWCLRTAPLFATVQAAEQWLEAHDERGNVR